MIVSINVFLSGFYSMNDPREVVAHCLQVGFRMSNLFVLNAAPGSIERFGSRGHRPTI